MRGAVIALVASTAALAASADTNPRVSPASGTRHTAFHLAFTLRSAPGHSGVSQTSYAFQVAQPKGSRAACAAAQPRAVVSGQAGQRRRVALPAPARGWCRGRYTVVVYLVSGPYCPAEHDQPCPEFATREQPAGRTSFRIHG